MRPLPPPVGAVVGEGVETTGARVATVGVNDGASTGMEVGGVVIGAVEGERVLG